MLSKNCVTKCNFEQVAYLLLHGELPNPDELKAFEEYERTNRNISDTLKNIIKNYPKMPIPWIQPGLQ